MVNLPVEGLDDVEDVTPIEDGDFSFQADEQPEVDSSFNPLRMPGITDPLGFFDPAGFSTDASEGKMKFYREVELKHGRISMLAALGIPIAEQFHPLVRSAHSSSTVSTARTRRALRSVPLASRLFFCCCGAPRSSIIC